MKFFAFLSLALFIVNPTEAATVELSKRAQPQGIDVSSYQGNVNWGQVKANGIEFVYIKATEGTDYINPYFNSQYTGATNAGLIRGSYHFARPGDSSGAAQANFFLAHGGGWTGDGITLPGAVDLEAGCYGLSAGDMVQWVHDFSDTYNARVGRPPVIYTTTSWWQQCTGDNADFGNANPLWIARWASSVGNLPAGWPFHTFWQYSDNAGANPGDADVFNGDSAHLERFAKGS